MSPAKQIVLAIGTRKGLWLARSRSDESWVVEGPYLVMREVPSLAFLPSEGSLTLLAGVRSEHWGPVVVRSDDLGATWEETEDAAVRFPEDAGAALERIWQLHPDPGRPELVWAGCEPSSLWRSTDGGRRFSLVRGLWEHPHRKDWFPGAGGAAVHSVVTDPSDEKRVTVAASTGGVYATDDGGRDVAAAQPGHRRPASCPIPSRSTASASIRSRPTPTDRRGCTRRTTAASTAVTTPASGGQRSMPACRAILAFPS